ncbi:Transmembrane protein 254 [Trinorchestia longiramus]|nr:Transmembrane protein 254 [Trinorchestia longiramus]
MNSVNRPRKIPRSFFIAVHPVLMVLTLAFLYLVTMGWLWPNGVSTKMYGQISDLVFFLGTNYNKYMMVATCVLLTSHLLSGFVSLVLCYRLNLRKGVTVLWFIQTLLFGFSSLQYLLWPHYAIFSIYND